LQAYLFKIISIPHIPGKYSYAGIWAKIEEKHTFESKAQNTDQSQESTRIEGPT
jgi:hypothetical protein